jgi:hypothetical protein
VSGIDFLTCGCGRFQLNFDIYYASVLCVCCLIKSQANYNLYRMWLDQRVVTVFLVSW